MFCTHCKTSGHSFENCFKVGNAQAPLCNHCTMSGHFMDRCYKLHGYLLGHKLFNKNKSFGGSVNNVFGQKFSADNDDKEPSLLTKGQVYEIMALLKSNESFTVSPSANHIQTVASSSFPIMSGISICQLPFHTLLPKLHG